MLQIPRMLRWISTRGKFTIRGSLFLDIPEISGNGSNLEIENFRSSEELATNRRFEVARNAYKQKLARLHCDLYDQQSWFTCNFRTQSSSFLTEKL